ncbi:MAG TPA: DUF1992 domain-containing protein [Desulfosporosinus sp.]|nr:DUF1992 domain-containing protein [Desulfosporosinus sp.]
MKDIYRSLTELRIREAIARGDFKNLPGAGKPLRMAGLYFLPRKLRAACIVLKNSGYFDQSTKSQDGLMHPTTANLNSPMVDTSISKQELSQKVLSHKVMMDCRHRR